MEWKNMGGWQRALESIVKERLVKVLKEVYAAACKVSLLSECPITLVATHEVPVAKPTGDSESELEDHEMVKETKNEADVLILRS